MMGESAVAESREGGTENVEISPRVDTPEDDGENLSRDELFEILSNRRRRYTLHHLQQKGGQGDLGDISTHVAAWENNVNVDAVTSRQRKRVYTSLQQFHLPKLDDHGVVEFEDRGGNIELTEPAEDIELYMEVINDHDIPWSYYYLGLTILGTGLVTASILGVPLLSSVPDVSWAAFLLVTFGVSALAHHYMTRKNRLGSPGPPPEVDT